MPEDVVEPRFESVADAFRSLLQTDREVGAALSVWREGKPLIDVCGGWSDLARTRPWRANTLVMTYSTGKPLAAIAALRAVQQGFLTLDAPVAAWWPEYATHGKAATTLRQMLSHTAGLPAFSRLARALAPGDTAALVQDLVAATPRWAPGSTLAEHALTYGHLIEGALRAVEASDTRASVADFAQRLGVEFWFGVSTEDLERVADMEIIDDAWVRPYLERPLASEALTNPAGLLDPGVLNSEAMRQASFPAIGLFTNARSLAKFYDDLPRRDGVLAQHLGPELHGEIQRAQATGFDGFVGSEVAWSCGLRVDGGEFGMGGLGGSCAWYSPELNYSFAYVTRGLGTFDRVDVLADAVEAALR